MKSERITIFGSPEFRAYLLQQAQQERITVSELVRRRCMQQSMDEEVALAGLANEVQVSVEQAQASLTDGLNVACKVLTELEANRMKGER